jgi:glycerol kinase
MTSKILTIDQGTTSSRSIIFDLKGKIQQVAQKEYPLIYPKSGWVEINPDEIINSVVHTLSKIDLTGVETCGITNQRETTLIWDKETGKPIYNAIVWQDRRTTDICSNYKDHESMIQSKTGLVLDPYFSATKIRWILDNVKDAQLRAEAGQLCFGTVDSFLMFHLSKGMIHKTDFTNASRTMLFNINNLDWDEDLLKLFNIPRKLLPSVHKCDHEFGTAPLLNNITINGVLGDQQSAMFGQGCLSVGSSKSTYGTGCFLMCNIGETVKISQDGLLTTVAFNLSDKIYYALEGSIYSAGTVVQWLRDNLQFFSKSSDSEIHLKDTGDSNEVLFIPAFNGLGAPYWNSKIRASFHNIKRDTTKEDLITAAFNSIIYQTKDILSAFENVNLKINELKVDGGMVENKTFVTNLTNLLNIVVKVPVNKECTALGAALMAAIGKKLIGLSDLKEQTFEEINPHNSKINENLYKNWSEVVSRLIKE